MKSPPEAPPRREFFAINGLRFLAAIWVLLFHASIHCGTLNAVSLIQPILNQGVLAMTLFFMLSGFILSYRYTDFATQDSLHEYVSARIGRLYPVYLFMGVTTIWRISEGAGKFAIIQDYGYLGAVPFVTFAVFLFVFGLQAWFPNLFGTWNFDGSWSLSVEAFFYSLFPKLRQGIRRLDDPTLRAITYALPVTIGLISFGLLISETRSSDNSRMFYVLPVFRLPEFMLGMCGYALFVERKVDQRILAWSSLMATPVLLAGVYWRDLPGLIEWGAPASVVFMGVFVGCLSCDGAPIVKAVVNYLGRISYCVYMAQFTTIPILKRTGSQWSVEFKWLILFLGTLILAVATYHLVEVLAYSSARRLSEKAVRKLSTVLSGPQIAEQGGEPNPPMMRDSKS